MASFISGLESFFGGNVKAAASDFCSLLAPIHSHTLYNGGEINLRLVENHAFLAMDGSLVSFIRWEGMYGSDRTKRSEASDQAISAAINLLFEEQGGVLEWTVDNPADDAARLTEKTFSQARTISKSKGILLDEFLDSEIRTIQQRVRPRSQIVAVWTPVTRLSAGQIQRHQELTSQIMAEKKKLFPKDAESLASQFVQNAQGASQELEMIHDTRVSQMINLFTDHQAKVKLLEWDEALYSIKTMAHPSLRGSAWQPHLAGTTVAPRDLDLNQGKINASSVMPVSIGWQIFSENPIVERDLVFYDGYWHAPRSMVLGPHSFYSIESIIKKMPLTLPWRMRVVVSPCFATDSLKDAIAYAGAIIPTALNKAARDSIIELNNRFADGIRTFNVQIVFDTWARTKDQVRSNVEDLTQELLSAGNPKLSADTGSLRALFIATLPGLNLRINTPQHKMEAEAVGQYFGGAYPANLLKSGTEVFLCDGQLLNAGLIQSELSRYIGAIVGGSGSGKSMLLNSSKMLKIATQGSKLPYMLLLDINASGKGVIDFVNDNSAGEYADKIVFHKLSKDKEGAHNPLDLRLGMRMPLSTDLSVLSDLLCQYVTPSGQGGELTGMRDMIYDVLVNAYTIKMQDETAERYKHGIASAVDFALAQYPDFISLKSEKAFLTWFEVVDFLSSHEEYSIASMANIYTSPLIPELPELFKANAVIYNRWKNRKSDAGTLFEIFEQMISTNKKQYPCFSYRTRISFNEARIVILDLVDVTPPGNPEMAKMFYALAFYMGAKNYILADPSQTNTILDFWPAMYHKYWGERIKDLRETPKTIEGDEIHRTGQPIQMRNGTAWTNPTWRVINTFAAELRKSGGGLLLASTRLQHFSPEYLQTHCSVLYLGGNWSQKAAKDAQDLIPLDDDEVTILATDVHGIKAGVGSRWMVKMEVGETWRSFVGDYVKSPESLWMLTTTIEDNSLLASLVNIVGDKNVARRILMNRFPKGSAKTYMEELRAQADIGDHVISGIYEYAAGLILDGYNRGIGAIRSIS
jgi:intracellular multiplication protein IcmB